MLPGAVTCEIAISASHCNVSGRHYKMQALRTASSPGQSLCRDSLSVQGYRLGSAKRQPAPFAATHQLRSIPEPKKPRCVSAAGSSTCPEKIRAVRAGGVWKSPEGRGDTLPLPREQTTRNSACLEKNEEIMLMNHLKNKLKNLSKTSCSRAVTKAPVESKASGWRAKRLTQSTNIFSPSQLPFCFSSKATSLQGCSLQSRYHDWRVTQEKSTGGSINSSTPWPWFCQSPV